MDDAFEDAVRLDRQHLHRRAGKAPRLPHYRCQLRRKIEHGTGLPPAANLDEVNPPQACLPAPATVGAYLVALAPTHARASRRRLAAIGQMQLLHGYEWVPSLSR